LPGIGMTMAFKPFARVRECESNGRMSFTELS
jgi:hypothetical protein